MPLDDMDTMGDAMEGEQFTPAPLVFPPHLLPVAVFRARLRVKVYDAPITGSDLPTVLDDAALDEGLREALSKLSVYLPATRVLPPLTLTAGQDTYPLPDDFADPVEETWGALLGSSRRGLPGGRYALLRAQAFLDAPFPGGTRSTPYGDFGAGGFGIGGGYPGYGSSWAIAPEDAAGNLVAGGTFAARSAALYPADFDHPSPYLLLSPPPTATGQPMTTLTYRAAHLPRRMTLDGNGDAVFVPVPLAQEFNDATDVLPFAANSDLVRMTLAYAAYQVLTQKVLSFADVDAEQWAFYQVRSGLGRKDILAIADAAKSEFEQRTSKRGYGMRG